MKNIGRKILMVCLGFTTLATPLFAATEQAGSGSSLLLSLFIGFFALIVVFQLVPACLMFIGMVKGLARSKDSGQTDQRSTN